MSYEITITETREVRTVAGKEWQKIDTEEVEREDRWFAGRENEPRTRIKDVMGYTPEIERSTIQKRELLKQIVDKLDLIAVIAAINGMNR